MATEQLEELKLAIDKLREESLKLITDKRQLASQNQRLEDDKQELTGELRETVRLLEDTRHSLDIVIESDLDVQAHVRRVQLMTQELAEKKVALQDKENQLRDFTAKQTELQQNKDKEISQLLQDKITIEMQARDLRAQTEHLQSKIEQIDADSKLQKTLTENKSTDKLPAIMSIIGVSEKQAKQNDNIIARQDNNTPETVAQVSDKNILTQNDSTIVQSSNSTTAVTNDASTSLNNVKKYLMNGQKPPVYDKDYDIDLFFCELEEYFQFKHVDQEEWAGILMGALNVKAAKVSVYRELSAEERKNYNTVKNHLLQRFDPLRDPGQRRLLLQETMRKPNESLRDFYTNLLVQATKAFDDTDPAARQEAIDKAVRDAFIRNCGQKDLRGYLIREQTASAKEALSKAEAYLSAMYIKYIFFFFFG